MSSAQTFTPAYTPLESLMLFQYLSANGVDHAAFRKVSDLLINNLNVREDPKFDSGRLSADALTNFYSRLLDDEAQHELKGANGVQDAFQNGEIAPGSRKRKATSPSLATVHEASRHAHLIPQLIAKLYSRYRSNQIEEIRAQERRYNELQKEIKDIEAGQWDDRLKREISTGQWDAVLGKSGLSNGQQNGAHVLAGLAVSKEGKRRVEVAPGQGQQTSTAGFTIDIPARQVPVSPGQSAASMQPPASAQPLAPHAASTPQPPLPLHQSPYGTPHPPPRFPSASPQPPNAVPPRQQQSPYSGPPVTPYAPGQNAPSAFHSPSSAPPGSQYGAGSPAPPYPRPPQTQPALRQPPSRAGGVELPPFSIAPPSRSGQQPYPQQVPFGHGPGQIPPQIIRQPDGQVFFRPLHPGSQIIQDVLKGLGHSSRKPSGQPTRWKSRKGDARSTSPRRPEREVSPLSPPPPTSQALRGKQRRKQQPTPSAEGSQLSAPEPPRSTRTQGRRGRGGSVASSAVTGSNRGRTRSASVTSRMSIDNESISGRRVKNEPSTPADMHDEVSATIEASPSNPLQRSRRAMQLQLQTQTSRKRRRSVRGTSEPSNVSEEPLPRTPGPTPLPTHVLASKNFARTCNPVMNDILSHKHASLFSNPVKERDAPNYYDIILRPQDFKSIKTAIANGQKTVAAIVSDSTPSHNSPASSSGGHVLLPVSADLVPPKAIVNSSQLEKEIARVFANAAMYNIGNDPVVQDAREMWEAVQKSVNNWRGAERTAEMAPAPIVRRPGEELESEADDVGAIAVTSMAPTPSEGGAAPAKRRKIG